MTSEKPKQPPKDLMVDLTDEPISGIEHSSPRVPLKDSPYFALRKKKTKWPTFRKAYLNKETIPRIRGLSGIVFLTGTYETNLNKWTSGADPTEQAVFLEARRWTFMSRTKEEHTLYLLAWIDNYYNGSVFHCAWQYPHSVLYDPDVLEDGAVGFYRLVALRMYGGRENMDKEVREFIENVEKVQGISPKEKG